MTEMTDKVRAADVADYILKKQGSVSAMKLQKLVYYAQAWSLVWTDRALFNDDLQAWADGPVVPALYRKHKGKFLLSKGFFGGDPDRLSPEQGDVVDKVLAFYGAKDAQWLSNLTHLERPWKDARRGLNTGERGSTVISKASIQTYYASL